VGNGTFNLTALWRALGVKNPETSLRETVQPVIIAQDFSALTPPHVPPTIGVGTDVPAVLAENSTAQVEVKANGGSWIVLFTTATSNMSFGLLTAVSSGLTVVTNRDIYSREDSPNIFSAGTVTPNPLAPVNQATSFPPIGGMASLQPMPPLWVPPGMVFAIVHNAVNTTANDILVFWIDCPASGAPL